MSMELPTRKRRGGRPRIHEVKPGDRVALNVRVTPELKKWIDAAALNSGRSQSQEVEFRLAHTMEREQLLGDALALRHGSRGAALMLALSRALRSLEGLAGNELVYEGGVASIDGWLDDPRCYDAIEKAFGLVLAGLHPTKPVATVWKTGTFRPEHLWEDIPVLAAAVALDEAAEKARQQGRSKKKGAAR